MTRAAIERTAWVLMLGLASACAAGEPGAQSRPNLLFILVDDLGWADLGIYGSPFHQTPNIDRLAAEGIRFTRFSAASGVCSPSRASIFTGKHPARLRITDWIGGSQRGALLPAEYERQLALDEVTFAELLRESGYATGYIGKWHLGSGPHRPEHQGFDEAIAVNDAGQPGSYLWPYRNGRQAAMDVPGLDGGAGDYLTDRLVDAAADFIERHAGAPFLLVLSHYTVHTPIEPRQDLERLHTARRDAIFGTSATPSASEHGRATSRLRQDRADYAAMVSSLDAGVGRLREVIERAGIGGETIVVLTSDNGGLSTLANGPTAGTQPRAPTSNAPLRAGKGWLYEGGIRVPLVVRWPGVVAEGATSDERATTTDLYPTLLEMAGLDAPPGQRFDGVSLVPALRGETLPARELFWHFPHYHGSGNRPSSSILAGELKLIEWLETGTVELYDLAADPGEAVDRAAERPEEVERLLSRLDGWRRQLDARMPRPNPDWREGSPG